MTNTELIERLRGWEGEPSNSGMWKDCAEAADTLDAQAKQIEALQADADLCNWLLTVGENQCLNLLDCYEDWKGEDSFKEYVLAARKGNV